MHKSIPSGAGLGGGSSDAAFMLKLLNDIQHLGLSTSQLNIFAAQLGADRAFFIHNRPLLAFEKRGSFQVVDFSLKETFFGSPDSKNIRISTREAYAGIKPVKPGYKLTDCISKPPEYWKDCLVNDFEKTVFVLILNFSILNKPFMKQEPLYASMSGSGSSIFGLFRTECDLQDVFHDCYYWSEKL